METIDLSRVNGGVFDSVLCGTGVAVGGGTGYLAGWAVGVPFGHRAQVIGRRVMGVAGLLASATRSSCKR